MAPKDGRVTLRRKSVLIAHKNNIFKKPRVEDPSRLRRGSRLHLNRPYSLGRSRGRPPGQSGGGGGAETDEVLKRKKYFVKVF